LHLSPKCLEISGNVVTKKLLHFLFEKICHTLRESVIFQRFCSHDIKNYDKSREGHVRERSMFTLL
jgi:hypothetical protein